MTYAGREQDWLNDMARNTQDAFGITSLPDAYAVALANMLISDPLRERMDQPSLLLLRAYEQARAEQLRNARGRGVGEDPSGR